MWKWNSFSYKPAQRRTGTQAVRLPREFCSQNSIVRPDYCSLLRVNQVLALGRDRAT
jgi:hypothetical protein